MATLTWPAKKPASVLDYRWEPPLKPGEKLSAASVIRTIGDVVASAPQKDDTGLQVILSGGTVGFNQFEGTWLADSGRTDKQTIGIEVREDPLAEAPSDVVMPPSSRVAQAGYAATPIWPSKDPDDQLDYGLNFADLIGEAAPGDTILTCRYEITDGDATVTKYGFVPGSWVFVVWLAGGSDGVSTKILLRIVTSKGRRVDQSVTLKLASR